MTLPVAARTPDPRSAIVGLIEWLAAIYPGAVTADEDLSRALTFLGTTLEPEAVVAASRAVGTIATGLAALAWLTGPPGVALPLALGLLTAGLLSAHAVVAGPTLLATARRTSALGDAPDLVARAVLRMRLRPSPEAAAAFAADSDDGPLASSLRTHVRRARGAPEAGLEAFGEEWADWFPELRRAVSLVEAAGDATEDDREHLLDRALDAVLEGTESAMRSFASEIRGPAMGLYAFGVLLPTALVSLLPAASMAGLPVTAVSVGLLYDLLLPLALLGASAWLLARRPVAFRPPSLDRAAHARPDRRRVALGAGVLAAVAGAAVVAVSFPAWAIPVAAVGYGTGVGLLVRYRPVLAVYDRVDAVEAGLSDALSLIGRRVATGTAAEAAVASAARELDGETATVLSAGVRQQRQLSAGLREAFLGRYGAARSVPSPRLTRSVDLVARAARVGEPAGEALLALGDHLSALQAVEERARHNLDAVCSTLRSTAAVFGPLVAGATVALADGMVAGQSAVPGGGEPLPWLGLVVGGYVLAMASILTTLSMGLRRGLDRPLVGYHVGRALVAATTTLLVAYALASLVA